jgi:O-antigen/teichoic acid export membrane protein
MTAPKELIGLFDMAAQLTARAMTLPDVLATIVVPRVAGDPKGRPALVAQCARVVAVVCGATLLVLVIFATPIVRLLFSPAFLPSVPLIRILAAGVLIRCAAKIFATYLTCTDRPGLASVATASGMVVNVALLLALMPVIGLAGAAVAMVGNYVVSSAILTIGFQRISGLGVRATWAPRWSDWAPLAEAWRRVRGRAGPAAADRP